MVIIFIGAFIFTWTSSPCCMLVYQSFFYFFINQQYQVDYQLYNYFYQFTISRCKATASDAHLILFYWTRFDLVVLMSIY